MKMRNLPYFALLDSAIIFAVLDQKQPGCRSLRKGRFSRQGGIYFITATTKHRVPRFQDFLQARIMSQQLHQADGLLDSRILCWVVMPDHIHILLEIGSLPLSRAMQRLKSKSAVLLNRAAGTTGPCWSAGFYDHALRKIESKEEIANYIIHNPIRARLAKRINDYPFWNNIWL